MTNSTVLTPLRISHASQSRQITLLAQWIKHATRDPEVGLAIAKNEALSGRLDTVLDVCNVCHETSVERLQEFLDGDDAA